MNYVMVVRPGQKASIVECGDIDSCLDVVNAEGEGAARGTTINVLHHEAGFVRPIARWAVGPRGLRRGPAYARNAAAPVIDWKPRGKGFAGRCRVPGAPAVLELAIDVPHRGKGPRPIYFRRGPSQPWVYVGAMAGARQAKQAAAVYAWQIAEQLQERS